MDSLPQRLKQERDDLSEKIDILLAFIEASNQPDVFGTLDAAEQTELKLQLDVMNLYLASLNARIELFAQKRNNGIDRAEIA